MTEWKLRAEQVLNAGPVVPVMVINQAEHAVPLARALVAGGIKVLEITLRTPVAMEALREIIRQVPDAIVGAGTVINTRQLREVTEAGAQFAISPGITGELVKAATEGPIPIIPGISTVSELMLGMEHGLREFKFFPAEASGGARTLQAIGGPFPQVRFCPTGGITLANCQDYLRLSSVPCIGGTWLAPEEALIAGDWERITRLAREAIEGAQGVSGLPGKSITGGAGA